MIKKFDEYRNINESLEIKISGENKEYSENFLNSFNNYIAIEKASGNYENSNAHFEITLKGGYQFAIAIFFIEDGANVMLMLPDKADGEGIDLEIDGIEDLGDPLLSNAEKFEMMEELKGILKSEGAFDSYSAVLNIEGYADFVKTFNSEEAANKFIKNWKDSWDVIKGTQLQGKRMGITEEK
ncbi:MAG: hypothetical protein SLAVMIC_00687 [uncultured marine phage]|uniref:Uncharacterized protein n=1 Tax=uncultured marine phage TaxID=707152 RepID=A0A8D9FRA7_9VIRU|nr:MAG: hypothetical protein SLAVMIC_00687 [uncultured marine phage]